MDELDPTDAGDRGDREDDLRGGQSDPADADRVVGRDLEFFWQQADTFWEYVLAILQGMFWPAFMVYEAFQALD